METKAMKSNNFSALLMHSFREKKNWFLMSIIIILVTTLLIPNILETDDFYIMLGVIETFAIVFINCILDNSFLHSDSKLAYYKSKPVPIKTQLTINILINVIFAGFLVALLAFSIPFLNIEYNSEVYQIFKIIIPWLAIMIFLSTLSSVLTGNTIMAAVTTIFNFALPFIINVIAMFVFRILENAVAGFSAEVLMEYFLNYIYRLDYIYFYYYSDNPLDYIYFVVLFIILTAIYLITMNCIRKRKNENTGNFIVFDGYKYFVSVLASLIVPAFFYMETFRYNLTSEILVSIIISIMSYYVIIAIIEKSFVISRLSIKIFAVCMTIFIVATGCSITYANQFKNLIPDEKDVKFAYIGSNKYLFTDQELRTIIENADDKLDENDEFIKCQRGNRAIFFTEKENIKNITKLHHEILSNQSYDFEKIYGNNIVFAYYMNDGSFIIRNYRINKNAEIAANNKGKDEMAYKLINSQEMKKRKFYYLYDNEYAESQNIYCSVINRSGDTINGDINISDIRDSLIKDIDNIYSETQNSFGNFILYDFENYYEKFHDSEILYSLEIVDRKQNSDNSKYITERIPLTEKYVNTLECLKLK